MKQKYGLSRAGVWAAGAMLAAVVAAGCAEKPRYRQAEGVVWNTTYHVTYRADADLADTIVAAMREVEMSLSPFQRGSLISRVNRSETDSVDELITAVFNRSVDVNRASAGAFDPTVAPLVNAWGFGYAERSGGEPTAAVIDSCLLLVGIGECSIAGGRMVKKSPLTEFNFSAITKGFGCDRVGQALARNGVADYMVEIGGEIAVRGRNPRGGLWRVMVDAPTDTLAVRSGVATIALTDRGVATSGNYRNYRETPLGRVGHTISPTTGYPVESEVLSATVVAVDAMTADALATASMAMPLDSAVAMIERFDESASALFVVAVGDSLMLATTPRWKF